MLLGDLAQAAPEAGLRLSVTSLSRSSGQPAARRLEALGVRVEDVDVGGLLSPRAVLGVRRSIASARPDVVHTHLDYADVLGGAAARSLGLPSVCTLHVMRWAAASARDRVRLEVIGRTRRWTAARVIAVSDAAREAYLACGWDRPERVVTVHNGVARAARPGSGPAVRAGLGLPADALVVTMLSVLRGAKGHEEALAAVQALRGPHPDLRLVVAGTGPEEQSLRALARRLGGAVVFAGHRDDVMALLDATDVLLHPSHVDAFPTALLEAMAASVPVVATAVGGIPEMVADGKTGLLMAAPPEPRAIAAALGRLLTDADLRASLGEGGRAAFAQGFTADRWCEALTALYREVA